MALILASASVGIAAVATIARIAAYRLAARVAQPGWRKAWFASCFAATLLRWSIAGVVVLWLLVLAQTTWFGTPTGNILGAVVAGGVVAGWLLAMLQQGGQPFWRIVHDSLEASLPRRGPRRQVFNEEHLVLLGGGRDGDPRVALARILGA